MTSHGTHPSMHPGVLRYTLSFINLRTPVPATAQGLFTNLPRNCVAYGGPVALNERGQGLMQADLDREARNVRS